MEKILLFQIDPAAAKQIARLASAMKIKAISVSGEWYNQKLGWIADHQVSRESEKDAGNLPGSLLVFCGLTERHLDKMLLKLRQEKIAVDFKAVLTPTNREWTVQRLYLEMVRERKAGE